MLTYITYVFFNPDGSRQVEVLFENFDLRAGYMVDGSSEELFSLVQRILLQQFKVELSLKSAVFRVEVRDV